MLRVSPRDRYQSASEVLRTLELEPYVDKLSDCLSTQPRQTMPGEDLPDGYVSPIVRTAIAIRRWRARLKLKERLTHQQDTEQSGDWVMNSRRFG